MKLSEYSKSAVKIAISFFVFGFFWILLSDKFAHQISPTNHVENQLQTYKGWFFILITTLLIYFLVKQQVKKVVMLKNKLMKSDEQYKKIVALTHDLIWQCDSTGKIIYVNDACKDIYGYAPEEMIGKNFSEFTTKNQYVKSVKSIRDHLPKGKRYLELNTEVRHRDGRTIYLKDAVQIIVDDEGKLQRVEGASTNITGFRNNQIKLIEKQQQLELAMYGGEIGLWIYWLESEKLILNEGWREILGIDIKQGDVEIEYLARLVHPEDMQVLKNTFGISDINSNDLMQAEIRMMNTDGEYRWINAKGRVTDWAEGKPLRMMGAITNITEKKNLELELKNLVKLYSSFISYSSEGIYLFELKQALPTNLPIEEQIKQLYHYGYIRTCNDAFAKMYGYNTGEEMVGTDQETLHGSDDNPENIALLKRFIKSGYRIMNDVTREIDKDGNALYISNNVVGIIENGKLLRTWGSQRNITQQVIAQQKIEESENRYRLLFETNPVPLIIFNAKTHAFHDVNKAMEKLSGYRKDELLKMSIMDIRPKIDGFTREEFNKYVSHEFSVNAEINLSAKSGKVIPCEVKFDQIKFQDEDAVLGAIIDLTLIRDAEKKVIQSLIEGADSERLRVAKEIHDGLGQHLTAASLNLSSAMEEAVGLSEQQTEKLKNGLDFLKTAIEESRNIAHNLMPKAIVDYGVILSLNSLFNQIERSTDIKINFFENIGDKMRLDLQTELNIYRITQEAINNVIKHAKASEVFVQLILHPSEIIFTFEDNGIGFDKLIITTGKKGIGIKSMFNRAKAMSGSCDIDSAPGEGTTITVVIPL